MPDDVDYQKNLFNDQFKLLVDNYQYYKSKILANEDFINAFKSLNLKAKIEFNFTHTNKKILFKLND